MTISTSQRFVLDVVRACLPRTGTGVRFGDAFNHNCLETDGAGARAGVMSITIKDVKPLIRVDFSILGVGDGVTWNSCRCALSLSTSPDQKWEYFCERQPDGSLRVRTMVVMRRCLALKKAVDSALKGLGGTSGAIEGRLQKMGYPPGIEGIKQYVAEVFALVDVEVVEVMKDGISLPEIRGVRASDSDLDLRLFNPPAISSLNPAC